MLGQGAPGLMPMALAQARQTALDVLVEVALDGASRDIGVGGDPVVAQAVALEPEDLHLALDAGIGVMVAVVGQGLPHFRSEVVGRMTGDLNAAPRSILVSSLCRCLVLNQA